MDTYQKLFNEKIKNILREKLEKNENPDEVMEKMTQKMPEFINNILNSTTEIIFNELLSKADELYADDEADKADSYKLIEQKWYEALKLLKAIITISTEVSTDKLDELNECNENEMDEEKLKINSVLMKLHSRSVQIGNEVFILIKSGYPDGALARWRSLHENTVIHALLTLNLDDKKLTLELVERFLDYSLIDEWKSISSLNQQRVDKEYKTEVRQLRNSILKKYGQDFKKANMWAKPLFPNKSDIYFSDLEGKAQLHKLNENYKKANFQIHTSPLGIYKSLSMLDVEDQRTFYLYGQSIFGNALPIQLLAISLSQITIRMLSYNANIDSRITMTVLLEFANKCNDVADEIRRKTERNQ